MGLRIVFVPQPGPARLILTRYSGKRPPVCLATIRRDDKILLRCLRHAGRVIALLAGAVLLLACGGGPGRNENARLGPRIVELGQPVPKGGGRYKLGSPYRLNGQLYTPAEVDRYDRTGIASWYGELFHGRRTANGEIYDMEALTAAHPTLPLPSYARVTNLGNGRSLVVRINDRGPYAHGRIIDLSWSVASLLQMSGIGTAPVRVQYLGPAPLGGGDRHEREVLAAQSWAGPRVAFAASPAKAMRSRQASNSYRYSAAPLSASGAITSVITGPMRPAKAAKFSAAAPVRHAGIAKTDSLAAAQTQTGIQPAADIDSQPASFLASSLPEARDSAAPEPSPPPTIAPAATQLVGRSYIEAGLFQRKATAERLASVLAEIAPASIQPILLGDRAVHRLRLGPFAGDDAAKAAVDRIRAAGLTEARLEIPDG